IYKNGSGFRSVNLYSPSTAAGATLSVDDIANGTDYYEMWAYVPSTGTPTIAGGAGTFFMGVFLGEVGTVTIGLAEVAFRASKGGTAQAGIPNAIYTKMSFGT